MVQPLSRRLPLVGVAQERLLVVVVVQPEVQIGLKRFLRGGMPRAEPVLEKLGLRLEGRVREKEYYKGRRWDVLLYGILKQEWDEIRRMKVDRA